MRPYVVFLVFAACAKPTTPAVPENPQGLTDGPTAHTESVQQDFADAHMSTHNTMITTARDAVINGKLEAVKEPMTWLAHHPPHPYVPPQADKYFVQMQGAARVAANAHTLSAAATGISTVATICGECHQALELKPAYKEEIPPDDRDGVAWHMARHRWAADRLWEGMIMPSDTLWNLGVAGLQEDALHGEELHDGEKMSDDEKKVADWLHTLGDMGYDETSTKSRASFFGELMNSCSECHSTMRAIEPPTPAPE